jgi:hypothetical protein
MSWKDLVDNGYVRPHESSRAEIGDLLALIDRDLRDAAIEGLSDDRRFATAYNAALQLAKVAIAASGYRPAKGNSAHFISFDAVKTAIPTKEVTFLSDYFDTCRRKRNHIDYDASEVVTRTETEEIIRRTKEFRELVLQWLEAEYPKLIDR